MRIRFSLLLAVTVALPLAGQPAPARLAHALNDGWRFSAGSVRFAERPQTSDAGWDRVNLPHTWNVADWRDDVDGYYRGIGWYRRPLVLDSALAGRKLYLHFEGANQVADVFVNGAFAGRHVGGYSAFVVDITRHVRFGAGAANLVAVKVDNSHHPHVAPLSVGYALYGGIYRDVRLIAADPVHLDVEDHAGPGVRVETPGVSRAAGPVTVRGTVLNESAAAAAVTVRHAVKDREGRTVLTGAREVAVPPGGRASFEMALGAVPSPRLWSPDDPYLYRVETTVETDGRIRDGVTSPLGFRWFRLDPAEGFLLNGQRLQLRGTNRHQDREGFGSALPDALHREDLRLVKAMGANFLRLAHYPQDPAVLEAADELGLLIWEEIPLVNYVTRDPEFTATTEQMLREMIRQHANHPSVVLWGMMNEIFLWSEGGERIQRQADTAYMRHVRELAERLHRLARQEDSTRPTAMAIHGSGDYDQSGVSDAAMVLGVNVYSGWYNGVFEDFGRSLDRRHAARPAQPVLVSEYGAEDDPRVNSLAPERFDFSGTWMRRFHESYLRQINARPWLAGSAIWNQFDFANPDIGGSIPHINHKGVLDFARRPKDAYYLYQANWTTAPVLHIASRTWTERTGTDSTAPDGAGPRPVQQPVDVYSNLGRVELSVNGRSLGAQAPDDVKRITWNVPLTDGENLIEARGTSGGHTVTDRLVIRFRYRPPRLADPAFRFRELAVNVGARTEVANGDGTIWEADRAYSPGSFGFVGGEAKSLPRDLPITGTAEAPGFFSYREGLEAYRMDVPDGEYEVTLRFAEPTVRTTGQRVFGVTVNGAVVRAEIDLAAIAGPGHAVEVMVAAVAAGGKGITVGFVPLQGAAILNGIRVRRR